MRRLRGGLLALALLGSGGALTACSGGDDASDPAGVAEQGEVDAPGGQGAEGSDTDDTGDADNETGAVPGGSGATKPSGGSGSADTGSGSNTPAGVGSGEEGAFTEDGE